MEELYPDIKTEVLDEEEAADLDEHLSEVNEFENQRIKDEPESECDTPIDTHAYIKNRVGRRGKLSQNNENTARRFSPRIKKNNVSTNSTYGMDKISRLPKEMKKKHTRMGKSREISSVEAPPTFVLGKTNRNTNIEDFLKKFSDEACVGQLLEPESRAVEFECGFCSHGFKSETHLREHIKMTHCDIVYECGVCCKLFTSKEYLINHVDSVHLGISDELPDTNNDEDRPQESEMTARVETANKLTPYGCSMCEKRFRQQGGLYQHIQSFHKGIKFVCSICKETFTQKSALKQHTDSIHNGVKFNCKLCRKTFTSKAHVRVHMRAIHLGIKHECNICHKEFSQKGHLKMHVDSDHKGLKFKCDLCDETFNRKSRLTDHLELVHEGRRYTCDLCGLTFGWRNSLKQHLQCVHQGIRFRCDRCGKTYRDKQRLNQHITLVHLRIHRHKCELCNVSFSQSGGLKAHNLAVHIGRRFECEICGNKYRQKDGLRKHIESFHQAIVYDCFDCNDTFTSRSSLQRHRKSCAHRISQESKI